jgi:hypothetical protein
MFSNGPFQTKRTVATPSGALFVHAVHKDALSHKKRVEQARIRMFPGHFFRSLWRAAILNKKSQAFLDSNMSVTRDIKHKHTAAHVTVLQYLLKSHYFYFIRIHVIF